MKIEKVAQVPVEYDYVITLSKTEAEHIKAILGAIDSNGTTEGRTSGKVWELLHGIGIVSSKFQTMILNLK